MYYKDNHIKLLNKDCRAMQELEDNSIQCVVTSPPYWGLRKYSGEQDLIWGDKECDHEWIEQNDNAEGYTGRKRWQHGERRTLKHGFCPLCGAWKGAYGLEPTPEMYVQHTIEILREIRRVLRKDGVVFWNIGDSYYSSPSNQQGKGNTSSGVGVRGCQPVGRVRLPEHTILKPKDLCMIPFRVAIAAQEDGWWVRSVIIWKKQNPMPESVTDRPTESHEYILMLTKSNNYYWDQDAVRENGSGKPSGNKEQKQNNQPSGAHFGVSIPWGPNSNDRNLRSVWEFPTQPYPEAHFAVFPEKLPELCIKAATPEVGCCGNCGAPYKRMVETQVRYRRQKTDNEKYPIKSIEGSPGIDRRFDHENVTDRQTTSWQPTCKCNADKVPSIVLDPFAGAGTALWVAKKLNRKAVGYELSKEYCQLIIDRTMQQVLNLT